MGRPAHGQRLIGADDPVARQLADALEVRTAYPARVEGTHLVHLCRAQVAADGAVTMRAICPGGANITRTLEPVEAGSTFIYCPACRSWAVAAGLRLPRSR